MNATERAKPSYAPVSYSTVASKRFIMQLMHCQSRPGLPASLFARTIAVCAIFSSSSPPSSAETDRPGPRLRNLKHQILTHRRHVPRAVAVRCGRRSQCRTERCGWLRRGNWGECTLRDGVKKLHGSPAIFYGVEGETSLLGSLCAVRPCDRDWGWYVMGLGQVRGAELR